MKFDICFAHQLRGCFDVRGSWWPIQKSLLKIMCDPERTKRPFHFIYHTRHAGFHLNIHGYERCLSKEKCQAMTRGHVCEHPTYKYN